MNNTKYIKVPVSEKLPKEKYEEVFTDAGLAFINKENNWRDENINDVNVNYWLEEVPDREFEMKWMLEKVCTELYRTDNSMATEVKQLLNELKQTT